MVINMCFKCGFLYCFVIVIIVFFIGKVDWIKVVSWWVIKVKFEVEILGLKKLLKRDFLVFFICFLFFVVVIIFKGIRFWLCKVWWICFIVLVLRMFFFFLFLLFKVWYLNVVIVNFFYVLYVRFFLRLYG